MCHNVVHTDGTPILILEERDWFSAIQRLDDEVSHERSIHRLERRRWSRDDGRTQDEVVAPGRADGFLPNEGQRQERLFTNIRIVTFTNDESAGPPSHE